MVEDKLTGTAAAEQSKSSFVTVVAWIFIVLAGFATFISLLQNIMTQIIFPKEEIAMSIEQMGANNQMPGYAQFMFQHFDKVFLLFLLVSTVVLFSSIALLKRKNWARIVIVILLSIGILWNIIGVVLQFIVYKGFSDIFGSQAPVSEFQTMMIIIQIFMFFFAIALSLIFGFIVKKMCSKQVKTEFVRKGPT